MANEITYNLAPNPRWLLTDLVGNILTNGEMFTYLDEDHSVYKPVYQDAAGVSPWPQPVPFAMNGMPNGALYWASDEDYFLAVFDQFDVPQFTVSGFNAPFASNQGSFVNYSNFVRNPQFTFWNYGTDFINPTSSVNSSDYIADDWLFYRNNNNADIEISRNTFNIGQQDVAFYPVYWLNYTCTNAESGGETAKYLFQNYKSVQTLSGAAVTVAFYGKSAQNNPLTVTLNQFFGTSGSPSASILTTVMSEVLSTVWEPYSATVTLPEVAGQSIGTDNNDALQLQFNFPLNQVASIDLCNVQMQLTSSYQGFVYETVDNQFKKLDSQINNGTFKTGDFKQTMRKSSDDGWLLCNDGTIGNSQSNATYAFFSTQALFVTLWNNVANQYCPVFNSNGTPAGISETYTTAFATNSYLLVSATTNLETGTALTVSSTVSLSAPLVANTTYYAINIDSSHIQVASSLANALAGIFIPLTSDGSGVQTLTTLRGASAEDDFNANRKIALTKALGRVLATSGQATLTTTFTAFTPVVNFTVNNQTFTANTTTDQLTLTSTAAYSTGTAVRVFNSGGGLPSPLSSGTTYYAILIDGTHIQLATSLANAQSNTAIDITSTGSGTNTVYTCQNLELASTASFYTGVPVLLNTTGTLPAPLATGTTYYAILIDGTHIQLATSLGDAIEGNSITYTTVGTPTNTITNTGVLTISDASSFYTGTPVTLTNSGGTLPAPLALSTTYYVIYLGPTYIMLASSLANAVGVPVSTSISNHVVTASIPIVITNSGSGINTVSINYSNWQPGQPTGQFQHSQTVSELPSHMHGIPNSAGSGGAFPYGLTAGGSNENLESGASGGSQPFNIMQPTTFVTSTMIKL